MGVEHMYFVDRSKIRETVSHIDDLLSIYEDIRVKTAIGQLSLEHLTHVLIESIIDVGNMMIDGFIMRDPGSYQDIIKPSIIMLPTSIIDSIRTWVKRSK